MKKKYWLLLLPLLPVLIFGIYKMYRTALIDPTAIMGSEVFYWNDIKYEMQSWDHREGGTIARTSDGSYDINRVVGDQDGNAVVIRSFLDQYLYVREGFHVPLSGEITYVIRQGAIEITDEDFYSALEGMMADDTEGFTYKTDNLYADTTELGVHYENCPLGTYVRIGFLENKWVWIDDFTYTSYPEDVDEAFVVSCRIIGEQYVPMIEKYLSEEELT